MASARSAWGIDIGNRALKAVKLIRDGDQLRVDDFEIIEHETVLSNSGDNRDALIQSALANFMQRHSLKGSAVSVAVSGQQSFARFIKLPPVEEKKIPEIVKFEAIQQIPFPLDDVEWSYQLFRDPESPDVEVGIFAMRKELLASHIKYFTDFDMNVQVVQLSPLAVYNAMFYESKIRGTTMLIDLGAENTDLIIADENSIWLRSIPIGGNNFTETLTKAFKLNFQKAEDLKRNAATSKYARQIFQAMRPVFADLVAEIQRSVGFYSSVHRDSRIKKCLAIGGTFKLPGLQKYLQQNLQLDIERLDTVAAAPAQDSKIAPNFSENVLSLVTSYGLAVQAMGDAKVDSSLLPAAIRREKMWKEKTKWFAAAAALFVVGTGLSAASWYFQDLKFKNNESLRASIDSVKSTAEGLSNEYQSVSEVGGGEKQRILNVRSMEAYRLLWGNLVADIMKALPAPQPELLDADPEVVKKIARGDRRQIVIDEIRSVYMPNLQGVLAADLTSFANLVGLTVTAPPPPQSSAGADFGGGGEFGPMGSEGMSGGDASASIGDPNAPKGFLVLARVITPNKNGPRLIDETFKKSLLEIMPTEKMPKVPYSIPKVKIITAQFVKDDTQRLNKIKTDHDAASRDAGLGNLNTGGGGFSPGGFSPGGFGPAGGGGFEGEFPGRFGGGGGFPGFNPGGGGPGAPDESVAYLDRKTGEDVRNDWIINVMFVVQLDPPPPASVAGGSGQASADGE
ncbi:MAG TPA: type IV pilus assembly protein PilM [Tepidisphaeraceae bacterium]|nr:type IV pilus assembly protein PilM [Tepidisphaeraceae bacterium]